MADSIRIKRLEKLALERASEVVNYELSDPRVEMVTITRVKLTKDLSFATIFWSSLVEESARSKCEHALNRAAGVVQREIGNAFQTRRTPKVRFQFDESIAGAIDVNRLIDELREEREERSGVTDDGEPIDAPAADTTESDSTKSADSAD